jgi:hypothetical protein
LEIFAVSIPNSDSRLSGVERMAFALHEKEIVLLPAFDAIYMTRKYIYVRTKSVFLALVVRLISDSFGKLQIGE